MIRITLTLILFLCCFTTGLTQYWLSSKSRDELFRGSKNPVTLYAEKESEVILKSRDSVTIVKIAKNEFTVEPTCQAKQITLFAVDSLTNDTLKQQAFKLRNIPPYQLYVGNVNNGEETRLLPNAWISYRIREFVPIDRRCSVRSFTLEVNGEIYEINGDRIPRETVEELYKLRRLFGSPNLTISIQAKITCSDCVMRNVSTYIILI